MKKRTLIGLTMTLGFILSLVIAFVIPATAGYGPGQVVPSIVVATTGGTIPAGKRHVEFILSSNFGGTIQGTTISGASLAVYDPGTPPAGQVFGDITYSIAAGNATITTW